MFLNNFFTKKIKLTEATADEKAAWVAQVTPAVEYAATQLGIDPRFIMDQWALETGYKIPANNNLGGLTNQGEETGFREYDDLEGYTRDWVNQINKNWPDLKGVETMDDYVDVLQTKGKNGVYAKEEPNTPTYRERLAGMKTGYAPSEKIMTAIAGQPDQNVPVQAVTPPSAVNANQNAIDILQKEFQSAMKRGDGKAMNDILASVKGLGGNTAVQQVAQGNSQPSANTAQAFTSAESDPTIDKLRQDSKDHSLSDEERTQAQEKLRKQRNDSDSRMAELRKDPESAEKNQEELNKEAEYYNKNFGDEQVDNTPFGSKGEEGFRTGKEKAKDEIYSPADLDLLGADIKQQAQAAKERGDEELAKKIEAKAEQVLNQAEKARVAGIQYIDTGGEKPAPIEQQVDSALDKMQQAQPDQQTDSGFKVSPDSERAKLDRETAEADRKKREAPQAQSYSAPVKSAGGDVKQGSGYSQGGVQKPATATAPQAQSYSAPVKSAGGAVKPGSGYGQGGVQTPATPKVDPYPNPGYTGEELRIYNQLSDGQKAKITTDFEKSKNNTAQLRKNITPGTGPTSYPDAKPRSLLDIKHQQTLSNIEGGKVLVDPAQARDVSKALGMRNLNSTEQKARDAAIAGLRFTAPSLQDIQKGMTPIVDKSTQYQSDQNANAYDGKIGDAYRTLGEPEVEPVKPVTKGSKQTVGSTQTVKPVKFSPSGAPIKETRDFENWVNSVGKV